MMEGARNEYTSAGGETDGASERAIKHAALGPFPFG